MKSIVRCLALICSMLLAEMPAMVAAQPAYPTKPVRLVVGFAAGGGADVLVRMLSDQLSRQLGQPVVIENRPGAGSTSASEYVAQSAPDGHTLLLGTANLYGPDQYMFGKTVRYDGVRDFTAITRWTTSPLIVTVSKASGIRTIPELVARARADSGKFFYSSAGGGVATHLAGVHFERAAGVTLTHVPFKGGAPAVQSVIAGDTQLTFGTPPSVMPFVKEGRLVALAVTSKDRSPLFPDLPSVVEAGVPGFEMTYWYGLYGPAHLPKPVIDKLFDASVKVLSDPDLSKRLAGLGLEVQLSTSPAEFQDTSVKDGAKVRDLMQQSGAKAD